MSKLLPENNKKNCHKRGMKSSTIDTSVMNSSQIDQVIGFVVPTQLIEKLELVPKAAIN